MTHDKPDLTDIFIELSNTPPVINEQHMKMLEIFILKVYNILLIPHTQILMRHV